jgi:hypothetical protein
MSPGEFERRVREFAQTKAWALSERETPTRPGEIEAFERARGVSLPAEYAHIASKYGCGDFGFARLLSVRAGPWHIGDVPGMPLDFVPISPNGCGDFYGFGVLKERCQSAIVLANHEEGYALNPTEFSDLYEYLHRYGLHAA